MQFKDRNVLITGGASGIGLATTTRFLQHGARVAMLDFDRAAGEATLARLAAEHPGQLVFIEADVGDYASCERAHAAAVAAIGTIDTLVNNAGISPKRDGRGLPVDEMGIAEWLRVIDVNLNAAFFLSHLVVPGMKAQGFGRIVNTSSVAAKAYLPLAASHYSTTKAAIIGLTRHLAGELAAFGITVNAIAPGRIDTAMVAMSGAVANAAIVAETPMRRLGQPREVADVVCFLSTRDDAGFVTGQVVDVAGGWLMT